MNNRQTALNDLVKLADTQGYLMFDDISDRDEKYALNPSDFDWLSDSVISRDMVLHEEALQTKYAADMEYDDYAQIDYGEIYKRIVELSPSLEPFVTTVSEIVPPQRGEVGRIKYQVAEGNEDARRRMIEMHLRLALKCALHRTEAYDMDIEDAVELACIGLITAVDHYDPSTSSAFASYASLWIIQAISRDQSTSRPLIYYPAHKKAEYFVVYPLLKQKGYIGCDRLAACQEAIDLIMHRLNCSEKKAESIIKLVTPDENYEGLCESACTQKPIDKDVYLASISQDAISDGDEVYETVSRLTSTEVLNNQLKCLSAKEKLVLMERNGFYGEPKTLEQVGQILNVTRERVRQIEIKAIKKLRIKLRKRGYNENGNSTSIGGFGRQSSTDIKDETVLYRLGDDLIHATGSVFDGGFLVHKGTEFTGHETLSLSIEYRVLRRELVNEGYIKNNVFVKDYVFNDKREAAIALLGRMVSRKTAKTLWDAGNPKTKVADNLTDTLVINLSQDNKNTDQTKESETVPNGGNEGGNAATDGEVGNPSQADSKAEVVLYQLNNDRIHATGSIVEGGFLVHEGAKFSYHEDLSLAMWCYVLRRKLLNEGYVKNNVFIKDYRFNDKRKAAMALLGKNIPERTAEALWIAEDSKPEVVDNLVDTSVIIQAKDNETDRSSLPSRKLYQETLMLEDPENSKSEVAVISPDKNSQSSDLKKDVLHLKGSWIHATGSNIYGGFLVHKGAGFARIEYILIENRYHSLRKKLIDKGYVKNNVFVKDYVFNDKREAAIVLLGRNIPEEAERVLWFATGSYKV